MNEAKRRQLYETWVRDYAQELYAFAYRLCGDAAQAEDLAQETFFEAWRSMRSLRDPQSARAWLFRILRHRYAHWLRDSGRRVRPTASLSGAGDALAARREGVEETLERQDSLQKALGCLDDRSKETFLMVFQQGMTCQEAADALETPLGTVLSRIHRARKALRKELQALGWSPGLQSDANSSAEESGGERPFRFRAGGER